MAFDDTFKHRIKIDEEVVFGLTGKAKEILEVQPNHFAGPVAQWAEERAEKFGDTVIPRHVYMEVQNGRSHRVAWVYHRGYNLDTEEGYEEHHIACDCLLQIVEQDRNEVMKECPAIFNTLTKRAAFVNFTYKTDEIARSLANPDLGDFEQPKTYHEINLKTMAMVLEHDLRHPEAWMANWVNGINHAGSMSVILQLPREVVCWYAENLQEAGYIDFDGENMRLTSEHQEQILADKARKQKADAELAMLEEMWQTLKEE